jgi:uncharacterized protein (TIGR02646 family)
VVRINKDPYPPEVRFTATNHPYKGQLKWRVKESLMLAEFKADPTLFNNGKYSFSAGYGYEEFRKALEVCQGSKCCFCEKPIGGGQIEHFRPKAAWQQSKGTSLNRPGYYWLAYRWENMLISCSECNNSGNKGNLFPVSNKRSVANSNCKGEVYEIINPAGEDPSNFISFNLDIPVAVQNCQRGISNINIFKLKDRGDLVPIRRDHLDLYKAQRDIASLTIPIGPFTQKRIEEAKSFVKVAQKNKQPFAGMIKENIKKGFI